MHVAIAKTLTDASFALLIYTLIDAFVCRETPDSELLNTEDFTKVDWMKIATKDVSVLVYLNDEYNTIDITVTVLQIVLQM